MLKGVQREREREGEKGELGACDDQCTYYWMQSFRCAWKRLEESEGSSRESCKCNERVKILSFFFLLQRKRRMQ